jgi:hypothetical protein
MQGLVDPNQLFKRDRDRDEKFPNMVRRKIQPKYAEKFS